MLLTKVVQQRDIESNVATAPNIISAELHKPIDTTRSPVRGFLRESIERGGILHALRPMTDEIADCGAMTVTCEFCVWNSRAVSTNTAQHICALRAPMLRAAWEWEWLKR